MVAKFGSKSPLALAAIVAVISFAPRSARAEEPDSYRHWQASFGGVFREQLHASSSPTGDVQSDLFYVVWFRRGMHAPYVAFGGTWTLGGVSYRDPTAPEGFASAFRASIGPSLRVGYGTTYDQGTQNGHSWFVGATFTTALLGAPALSSGYLPEHGTTVALRPAFCVAVPGWPHARSGLEDYAIILAAMFPSLVDVSLEIVPGRNVMRLGGGIAWEL